MTFDDVSAHYSFGGLRERIEAGLAAIGEPPSVESLGPVDEFHVGGRPATAHLIDQLHLGPQDHVLDIGSGLGGTARFIASHTGARVTGIDLTIEYVEVARWLSELVNLGDLVSFRNESATDLTTVAGEFSAATMVHVGMNIADKAALFVEVANALEVGGTFGVYDIMKTGDVDPTYPLPWAANQAISELATADNYVEVLGDAGFEITAVTDRSEHAQAAFGQLAQAAAASGGPPPLGLHLVMGPTTPTKIGNLRAAIDAGILAPTEIISTRTR